MKSPNNPLNNHTTKSAPSSQEITPKAKESFAGHSVEISEDGLPKIHYIYDKKQAPDEKSINSRKVSDSVLSNNDKYNRQSRITRVNKCLLKTNNPFVKGRTHNTVLSLMRERLREQEIDDTKISPAQFRHELVNTLIELD